MVLYKYISDTLALNLHSKQKLTGLFNVINRKKSSTSGDEELKHVLETVFTIHDNQDRLMHSIQQSRTVLATRGIPVSKKNGLFLVLLLICGVVFMKNLGLPVSFPDLSFQKETYVTSTFQPATYQAAVTHAIIFKKNQDIMILHKNGTGDRNQTQIVKNMFVDSFKQIDAQFLTDRQYGSCVLYYSPKVSAYTLALVHNKMQTQCKTTIRKSKDGMAPYDITIITSFQIHE
jgi:hypothetical protein